MPRESYTRVKTALEDNNTGMLLGALVDKTTQRHLMALGLYIASVFDIAADPESAIYVTIGVTRARDAFLLTEKGEAGNCYAGGEHILGWLEQIADKLLTADQLAALDKAMTPPPRK